MALLEVNWNPSRRELKQFALLWIVFFGLFGGYVFWAKGSLPNAAMFWTVAAFGVVGVFAPNILQPVYVVWMALALPIGWCVSHLLLLIVYYLVLTPIGLLMRLFGKDPMNRHFERSAKTYWTPHETNTDPAQYFKQF